MFCLSKRIKRPFQKFKDFVTSEIGPRYDLMKKAVCLNPLTFTKYVSIQTFSFIPFYSMQTFLHTFTHNNILTLKNARLRNKQSAFFPLFGLVRCKLLLCFLLFLLQFTIAFYSRVKTAEMKLQFQYHHNTRLLFR